MWHSTRTAGSRCGGAGVLLAWNHPVSENAAAHVTALGWSALQHPTGKRRSGRTVLRGTIRYVGRVSAPVGCQRFSWKRKRRFGRTVLRGTMRYVGRVSRPVGCQRVSWKRKRRSGRTVLRNGGAALAHWLREIIRFRESAAALPSVSGWFALHHPTGKRRSGRTVLRERDGPGEPSYGNFSLSSATLLMTGRYLPEGAGSMSSTSSTVTWSSL